MSEHEAANLRSDDIDRLGKALLSLSRELWVVKDRLFVLEAALADQGIIAAGLLDDFQPDEALQQKLESERAALITSVLDALQSSADQ